MTNKRKLGYDPKTGAYLVPVTPEILKEWGDKLKILDPNWDGTFTLERIRLLEAQSLHQVRNSERAREARIKMAERKEDN